MNAKNFAYWLQGYFEVLAAGGNSAVDLTVEQVACIKDHLALVLEKRTPERRTASPAPVVTADPFTVPADPNLRWVAPPINPNQVRVDIEAEVKKRLTGVEHWPSTGPRTYCRASGGGKIC